MGRRRDGMSRVGKHGATIAAGLLVAVLTLLVYLPWVGNDFVYDDRQYVVTNPGVTGGLSAEGVGWALTSYYASNWHPLTWLSHQLDVSLFGVRPGPMHAVNDLLHAANAVLLMVVLRAVTGSLGAGLAAALLFALHPLHVESAAWIAERKDLLSALFLWLTLLAWRGWLRRPGPARYLAVMALFALGLTAKPMLVTLPALLLVLDWWPLGRLRPGLPGGTPPGRLLVEKAPLAILSAVSAALTMRAQAAGGGLATAAEAYPAGVRLANALYSAAAYLVKTALPFDLAVFYPHPGAGLAPWKVAGAVLLLAGLTALAWCWRRRSPWLAAGWLWYLVSLVPVVGLVQAGAQGMADRYTYLPLTGVFVALAREVGARLGSRVGAMFLLAASLAMAGATTAQLRHWRDDGALFGRALAVTRDNWVAHNNLGAWLRGRGDFAGAVRQLEESARIRPGWALARLNLGRMLDESGRTAEAERRFREALALAPHSPDVLASLALALERLGRREEALRYARESLRFRPDQPIARRVLGRLTGGGARP
jgi:tetratricopeptide (TPR) repeat protein